MSIAVTLSAKKSLLESYFHPPLNLEGEYECGLIYFSAFNTIPNITSRNNTFSYGKNQRKLKLPVGCYDLYDIFEYLEKNIHDCEIKILPNNNTLKCSVFCSEVVNFDVENSIANLLGFSKTKLEANKWHESEYPVNILPVPVIRIECNLIQGSFINGFSSHTIYEFVPNVPPGFRFIETPRNIVYFPIKQKIITQITVKIIDNNSNYVDFREEDIQLRIHLRRAE